MNGNYLYSIFIPKWKFDNAFNAISEYIQKDPSKEISIEGVDECYMKSYKSKDRTITEICISTKTLKDFDELWTSKFGRSILRDTLGYNLYQIQRGVYSIYKRPNSYKIKPKLSRMPKRRFIPF